MTQEITALLEQKKGEFDAKIAGLDATIQTKAKEAFNEFETKMKEAHEAEIKGLTERLDGVVAELKAKNTKNEVKTLEEAFVQAYQEQKSAIEKLASQKGGETVVLELKTPVNVGLSNTLFAGDTQVSITQNTNVISPIRSRLLTYLGAVGAGSIGSTIAMWVEEHDEQGTPIPTAELAAKPNISVKYKEKTARTVKFPAYTKVSTELLSDAPQLFSRIQNNLLRRINIAIENALFTGDGDGSDEDALIGLTELSTQFTGGTLADKVATPNNFDVLRAVALQAFENDGVANAIFVDAGALAEMDLAKGEDGHYLMPPFKTANGNLIAGISLIPTTAFKNNADIKFIGGDLSVVNVLFRQGLTIMIDKDGNDFTTNKRTILAEARLVQFASANDKQVLIKGNFTAAKALLSNA